MNILRSSLPVIALLLAFATPTHADEYIRRAAASTTVNPVIGDAGFIAAFGRAPDVRDDEDLRIAAHLSYVEILLRQRTTDDLSPQLRAERERNIQRLHDYRMRGVFPRNRKYAERRPCFIDDDGRICAVGFLVEQSAGRDVAEGINGRFQYARIDQMRSKVLDRWIERSGLTRREVAMIQPAYGSAWPLLWLGFSGGGDLSILSGYAPSTVGSGPASHVDGATTLGRYGGIVGEFMLEDRVTSASILFHLLYDTRTFSMSDRGIGATVVDPSGATLLSPTDYGASIDYVTFGGDLQFSYAVNTGSGHGLGISLGPSLDYRYKLTHRETLALDADRADLQFQRDAATTYSDDGRTAVLADGNASETKRLGLGMTAGIRGRLMLSRSLYVAPYASFNYALTDLTGSTRWRVDSFRFGVDLAYAALYRWVDHW